jgi:hypothetical protein
MPNIDLRAQITELNPSPLDSKNSPVEQKNDLSKIQRAYRYEGMTVYVKSEDCEYYLHNGTSDNDWVKKNYLYIESADTANGYAKSYKLIDAKGTQLGKTIDIPKDQFLSSATYNDSTHILSLNVILSNGIVSATNISLEGLVDIYESGTNIVLSSVTDGHQSINLDLPIYKGTGTSSLIFNDANNSATNQYSHAEGQQSIANGDTSHAEGYATNANGYSSHAEGIFTITKNPSEHASGQYNLSSSASTTFGDSGNTLFSVGNGTNAAARTNAFEIRQNGDIYLSAYTNSAKTAFEYSKLQDKLVNIQTISENAESSMHIFSAITISAANSAINAATSAETIAEHPNVVGSNGNWWSYNISSSSYTDTGIVSVGVPDITISDDSSEGEIAITYGDGVIDFSEDTDGDITITY